MNATSKEDTSRRGGAPERVDAILSRVLRDPAIRRVPRASSMSELWARAAGPQVAAESRPDTLRRGVLTVEVRSASLLSELSGFRVQELLAKVVEADGSGRITGLRFRLGVF